MTPWGPNSGAQWASAWLWLPPPPSPHEGCTALPFPTRRRGDEDGNTNTEEKGGNAKEVAGQGRAARRRSGTPSLGLLFTCTVQT